MIKRDTKTILLECGIELMREHGYHATGIHDILKAAGVPKGSFYHHFASKEDFGLAAVARYADEAYRALDEALSDVSVAPVQRLRQFFATVFAGWDQRSCREGCLLGNLGQELADVNDAFRSVIAESLAQWARRIAECLDEAQARGELSADIETRAMANQLIDGFEGAALRMKLVKSTAPLDGFIDLFFGRLLAA